jgi:hypothetical protein
MIRSTPAREELLQKIDAALSRLSVAANPWTSHRGARIELLLAIEEFQLDRSELLRAATDHRRKNDDIAQKVLELIDLLTPLDDEDHAALGSDAQFITRLRSIVDASARTNLNLLTQVPPEPSPANRPRKDREMRLAHRAAQVFWSYTGHRATVTKTETGRTGPALKFIHSILAAAGASGFSAGAMLERSQKLTAGAATTSHRSTRQKTQTAK